MTIKELIEKRAEEIYKNLEIDDLIKKAYQDREIVKLTFGNEASWKAKNQDE